MCVSPWLVNTFEVTYGSIDLSHSPKLVLAGQPSPIRTVASGLVQWSEAVLRRLRVRSRPDFLRTFVRILAVLHVLPGNHKRAVEHATVDVLAEPVEDRRLAECRGLYAAKSLFQVMFGPSLSVFSHGIVFVKLVSFLRYNRHVSLTDCRCINVFRPMIDAVYLCHLVRQLCVVAILSRVQLREGTLHSLVLPRPWLVEYLPNIKNHEHVDSNLQIPTIAVFCNHVLGIVEAVRNRVDAGRLKLLEYASCANETKGISIFRIHRFLLLVWRPVPDWQKTCEYMPILV
jgi:hypothetical protein